MMTTIETPRLRLREMSLADLDFVAAMLGDAEVMRFYPHRYTREQAVGWIERQMDRYARLGHGLWLVESRETGEPLGQVGLTLQLVNEAWLPELGWLVHRPHWRRGIATEAAAATRDHAFGALGLERVVSLIRPENLPSQGVARKLGMAPVGRAMHAGLEHCVFALEREKRERAGASGAILREDATG